VKLSSFNAWKLLINVATHNNSCCCGNETNSELPSNNADSFICDIFSNISATKVIPRKQQSRLKFLFVKGYFSEILLVLSHLFVKVPRLFPTRKQRRNLFGFRVKLPPVTAILTIQRSKQSRYVLA